MSDRPVPEELVIKTARLVNAVEDVRAQAADDLKAIWADFREELKALEFGGREISQEVGFLKGAIAETRKTEEDKSKAEIKADGIDGYLAILTSPRARAREGNEYAAAKGAANEIPASSHDQRHELVEGPEDQLEKEPLVAADAVANVSATNSHSAPSSDPAAEETGAGASLPSVPVINEAGPHSLAVPGGEPSIPSLDAGGAKMDEVAASPDRPDEKSAYANVQSKQAAPNSGDVPAFLFKAKSPADYRPHCQRPDACAASGLKHCYACTKAMAADEVPA